MKKQVYTAILVLLFSVSCYYSLPGSNTKINTDQLAAVDQIQGIYIFAKCKPVTSYEFVGTVSAPTFGNHEFDNLVLLLIKNCKKEYPAANALLFDSPIKQTHNTKCSAIKLKF
jgi:hypothetical protein